MKCVQKMQFKDNKIEERATGKADKYLTKVFLLKTWHHFPVQKANRFNNYEAIALLQAKSPPILGIRVDGLLNNKQEMSLTQGKRI